MATLTNDPVTAILALFAEKGDSEYGGEAVTQREHGLQAAACALRDGADDPLVVAALLHDLGHMLHDLPDDAPEEGVDDAHEVTAARRLAPWFGPDVTEPIRLHVDAKRYLTAVEPGYLALLSEPSVTSLMLQGGPMGAAAQEEFRRSPHWEAAVQLRRWDEEAKVPGAETPTVDEFVPLIRGVLRPEVRGTPG
jgi:[1-hydroxy-2-(trimethylamino)ethyl]phosphonate dioxygenase